MANSTMVDTVVGVFETPASAQRAVSELRQAGFTDKQIGVVAHNKDGGMTKAVDNDTKATEGAVTGLAAGAGVGALWGLAILSGLLPGIGPAIAGGTMGVLLSSAAAGAAAAGIGGALLGMGIPDEDAKYYETEFKSGRTIVTVKAGANAARAESIIEAQADITVPRAVTFNIPVRDESFSKSMSLPLRLLDTLVIAAVEPRVNFSQPDSPMARFASQPAFLSCVVALTLEPIIDWEKLKWLWKISRNYLWKNYATC
jgi:hypothetical protein